MYSLIIIIALSGAGTQSGGSVSSQVVNGFTSKYLCDIAASKIETPPASRFFYLKKSTACVKVSN